MKLSRCCLILFALALVPCLARAEKGFYIGTGIGLAVPYQSGDIVDDAEPAAGTAVELIHLGYNLSDKWGVGVQLGGASGPAEDFMGSDTLWGQQYADLSIRRSFGKVKRESYIEVGYGMYAYTFMADDSQFISDPSVGWRLALGTCHYLGNFYLGPEVSYHWVDYSEGDFDVDGLGEFPSDFDTTGNMLLVHLKMGWHPGRKK